MKKLAILATTAVLCFAALAGAQPPERFFDLPKFTVEPTLDGDRASVANEWAGALEFPCSPSQILLDGALPEAMQYKIEFSMALSYSAQGEDAQAQKLLNDVIATGDESLARSARLQLISMAEKQDPKEAITIYEELLATMESEEEKPATPRTEAHMMLLQKVVEILRL